MNNITFIAHVRKKDNEPQALSEHLLGVAALSRKFASKIGLGDIGEILGLLHDIGKYSEKFQNYIKSAEGLLNPDEDDYVDSHGLKGKIDHSTAGAQYVWRKLSLGTSTERFLAQILSLCLTSHHSGLIDCLNPNGSDNYNRRINKSFDKTFIDEVDLKIEKKIQEKLNVFLNDDQILKRFIVKLNSLVNKGNDSKGTLAFKKGLLLRYLFSCLIDADRINTADFESPSAACLRNNGNYVSWDTLSDRLDKRIKSFQQKDNKTHVEEIRQEVSNSCYEFSYKPRGLYQLTVPTGGGKTLSSLRFALNHAKKNKMERIIYIIPYTTIIDQNANDVREILEESDNNGNYLTQIVLEHHSNLTPDEQNWKQKILSEDWDAPVVFTTNVQVLEALFGAGTRGARRMHQLANSILIFDEIQTLPVRCVHMFNVALRFLVENCNSTVVLCTATQPLLDKIESIYHAISISPEQKIIPDESRLYHELKRVDVDYEYKPGGWTESDVKVFAINLLKEFDSLLIIVNTKKSAESLYKQFDDIDSVKKYHLSTSMCPAHRMDILEEIKQCLEKKEKIICVSTQLIEAGVNIDFNTAIRYIAGLDSIAQAAGRCNRNGEMTDSEGNLIHGKVYIINPAKENLDKLPDIKIGQDKTLQVLGEYKKQNEDFDNNIIGLKAMERYYKYYFYERKDDMKYKVSSKSVIGREDNLFNLLSSNSLSVEGFKNTNNAIPDLHLKQSFMSAAKVFKAIDSPGIGVIVPYKRGENIIAEFCASDSIEKEFKLLREAQRFSVNIFQYVFEKLVKDKAIHEVQKDSGIYYLDEQYYSKQYGLCEEPVSEMRFLGA